MAIRNRSHSEYKFMTQGDCKGHNHQWEVLIRNNYEFVLKRDGIIVLEVWMPLPDCPEGRILFSERELIQDEVFKKLEELHEQEKEKKE